MVRGPLSLCALLLLLPACASTGYTAPEWYGGFGGPQDPSWPPVQEPAPGWWSARLQDLLDTLPISIGVGTGFYVGARVPALGAGLGWTGEVDRYGWATNPRRENRAGTWHEQSQLGLLFTMARSGGDDGYDFGCMPFGPFESEKGHGGLLWTMVADVEGEVHLGVVGLRVGFSLIQFIDLFTSAFGWDLVGDDRHGTSRAVPRAWRAVQDDGMTTGH